MFHTFMYGFEIRRVEGHKYEMYVLQHFKKRSYLWVVNMFSSKPMSHIYMKIINFEDSIYWTEMGNAPYSTTQ